MITRLLLALLLVSPALRARAQDMHAPLPGDARSIVVSAEGGRPIPFSLLLVAGRDSTLAYPDTAYLGYTGQFSPTHIPQPLWGAAAACPGAARSATFRIVPLAHGDTLRSSSVCPPEVVHR
jgi:hypothetical protein